MRDSHYTPSRQWPYPIEFSQIEREADELYEGYIAGKRDAAAEVECYVPSYTPTRFERDDARHVLAKSYGFPNWSGVERYFESMKKYSCVPNQEPLPSNPDDSVGIANDFLRLACLTQGQQDHPARWDRARQMLADNPEIVTANIHTASAVGDVDAVRKMLKDDPECARTQGGPHGWEPLLYVSFSRLDSVVAGHSTLKVARDLLAHGADPNAGFFWAGFPCPYTVLTGAFGEGENGPKRNPPHQYCYELAELLINAGADPNDVQALYNRMFSRNDNHLKFLFAHGLGKKSSQVWHKRLGEQACSWVSNPSDILTYQLQWAARGNYLGRVKLLVQNGADVNRPSHLPDARSPYEEAVYHGNLDIAEYLLAQGACRTPSDRLDRFAGACIGGDRDLARSLLGEEPSLLEQLGDRRALLMENAVGSDNRKAVRLMIELGFDVNVCGMHPAARYGYLPMIKLLVELGADVHQQNPGYGICALGVASHYQEQAVIGYLAQFAGIHRAVKSDLLDCVRALLNENPQCANDRDETGNTPLHCLDMDNQMINCAEILNLLVSHGADVNARNNDGLTPLDKLKSVIGFSRRDDLIELLRRHGAIETNGQQPVKK